MVGVGFFAPLIYALAQTWHRLDDAFGTSAVHAPPDGGDAAVAPVGSVAFQHELRRFTQTAMEPGHRVELLVDGPMTLAHLDQDLRRARSSIAVQSYYCEPGVVADWLRDRLIERARAGVRVRFLRDGFGCNSLTAGWIDSLQRSGAIVATLRPVRWWAIHESMHRSHVRIVTIDGAIGYVGGFGIADKWIDHGGEPRWRESAARFTGPAVSQLATAFAVGWLNATGTMLTGPSLAAPPAVPSPEGGAAAGVMFTQRAYGTPVPERFLALAIAAARKRVWIANSYFVPNAALRGWLIAAARRGVDVRVLAPSATIDIPFTRWAGRSTFPELLHGGVRIYEYLPAMMHAKAMIIDDEFASIGSLNLDNLSLRINDEAVLHVQDRAFVEIMAAQYEKDLSRSIEITPDLLRAASLRERFMTAIAGMVRNLL